MYTATPPVPVLGSGILPAYLIHIYLVRSSWRARTESVLISKMDLIDYSVYYSNDSFSLAERNSSIRSIPTIPLISHDIAMYEYTAIESEDGLA